MQRWTRGKLLKAVFLCLLSTLLICHPALALNKERLDKWAANNIMFYDPDECEDKGTQTCTAKPEGKDITWIGDSYTEGSKEKIKDKMSGVDIHSMGSKQFGKGTDDNKGGLTILKELKDSDKLRKYVVMALGTNGDASGTTKDATLDLFDEMMTTGGSDKTYILMKPFTKNSNDGKADYSGFNEAVDEYKKDNSNVLVADWESAAKDKVDEFFASDAIHPSSGDGYQVFVDTFYNALPGGCGAGKLSGNTNLEKIWNYFVDANIDGVSTNAAVIAGILGNMQQESSFNPFATNGNHWGVYQEQSTDMKSKVEDAVGNLWGSSDATEDQINSALQIELDYLTTTNERFVGTGWATNFGFLKVLNEVSNDTPEAYSDLWIISVEGAVTGNKTTNNYIEDDGARSVGTANFSTNPGGGEYYQEAGSRRSFARNIYDTYANGTTDSSSDSDDTTAYSAPKTNNLLADKPSSFPDVDKAALMDTSTYTWEDGWLKGGVPGIEIEDVTGKSLLDYPEAYGTSDGKPNKILLHNTEGTGVGFSAYGSNTYPAHFIVDIHKQIGYQNLPINETASATVGADSSSVQIEIVGFKWGTKTDNEYDLSNFSANDWDYLAVLLAAIAQETGISLTTSMTWDGDNVRYTGTKEEFRDNVTGVVGHMHSPGDDHVDPGNIWPSLEEAIGRNPTASKFGGTGTTETTSCPGDNDDEQTNTVDGTVLAEMAVSMSWPVQEDGTCKNSKGEDVSWSSNEADCYNTPRDKYQEMYDKYSMEGSLLDCGHFISTVVHAAEVDEDFPKSGSDTMGSHMDTSDKWEKLSSSEEADLKPGDIMLYSGHIEMYVGDYGGEYGKRATASMNDYVGIIKGFRNERNGEKATAYRLKAQTSSALKTGGMTKEEADAFMVAYNNEAEKKLTGHYYFDGAYVYDIGCSQGTLNNCSAFTQWFLNRYTTMGPEGAILHQGSEAVSKYLSEEPQLEDGGKVPKPYAIMSMGPESGTSDDGWYNHTGIVLGINEEADELYIGEASCSYSYAARAGVYSLSKMTNSTSTYGPTYAYTDKILKGL